VPVLNEADHLEGTVRAMRAQDVDGTVELLFVDGGSTDGSVAVLRRLAEQDPRIRLLHNPDRIVPCGLNVGLRAARGRYVARMDAHTIYGTDYLRHGIARLRRGDVDWVSGPPVPVGSGRWSRRVAAALGSGLGRGASDKWQAEEAVAAPEEWALTTSVFAGVWRRETLDALGGWDPAWAVNEDSEMASRVLARGGRLVCRSEMAARYAPRDSLRGLARQYRSYGRHRAKTFARHPGSAGPLRVATAALPVALAAAVLPGRSGRAARATTAAYAALVGAQALRTAGPTREAPGVAAVLATMHVAFATGFLEGLLADVPRRRALRASTPRPIVRSGAGAQSRTPRDG
jgi:GT2 family glycosyltransferase